KSASDNSRRLTTNAAEVQGEPSGSGHYGSGSHALAQRIPRMERTQLRHLALFVMLGSLGCGDHHGSLQQPPPSFEPVGSGSIGMIDSGTNAEKPGEHASGMPA